MRHMKKTDLAKAITVEGYSDLEGNILKWALQFAQGWNEPEEKPN